MNIIGLKKLRALLLTANSTNDIRTKNDKISECIKLLNEIFIIEEPKEGGFDETTLEFVDGVRQYLDKKTGMESLIMINSKEENLSEGKKKVYFTIGHMAAGSILTHIMKLMNSYPMLLPAFTIELMKVHSIRSMNEHKERFNISITDEDGE